MFLHIIYAVFYYFTESDQQMNVGHSRSVLFSQIVPVLVLATVPRYDERGNVCPSETRASMSTRQ